MPLLACLLMAAACARPEAAEAGGWLDSFPEALAAAKKEDRPILISFGGSDWCVPCIQMKKKVYDTEAFTTYAKAHLVLLDVDFPMREPLPVEKEKENYALAAKFGAFDSYDNLIVPTLSLVDSSGRLIEKENGVFFTPDEIISWIKAAGSKDG